MFNRSTAIVNQGSRFLSPLSPISPLSATANVEARRGMLSKAVKSPATPVSPPTTASGYGFETSIMERLETALASPFSPKTFVRSFATNSPMSQFVRGNSVKRQFGGMHPRVVSLKPRKKKAPMPLPLDQPSRLSEESPLSPFKYPTYVETKATLAPISPSAVLSKISPVPNLATLTDADIRKQKMEKLARCLGETGPQEMVFPSFGQVGQEVHGGPSTYLDLYRQHSDAVDSGKLAGVMSPKPQDAQINWKSLDDIEQENMMSPGGKRKSVLRRSRSVGDFYSVEEILTMNTPHVEATTQSKDRRASESLLSAAPSPHPFASPINQPIEHELKRKDSVTLAKLSILGDDAKQMASFRMSFRPRPLDLSVAWIESPLSPAQPSALEVRSPRAPYWVKPVVVPKTPRTLRTEKRQGWGGRWDFVDTMPKFRDLTL
ncbi:hypothetical protein QCA50_007431 [Cerrena zonata]|uniref:Uncharacterized protein n=1 Tax=Cerrena zonata TaxID=2478898 RepID=A0AAW0G889_9APHY